MIVSRTGEPIRRRTSLALSLAILYLVLALCVPITAFAEETEGGNTSTEITEISAPDLDVGADDVDISKAMTPPAGSATIVEVVESGKYRHTACGRYRNKSGHKRGKVWRVLRRRAEACRN